MSLFLPSETLPYLGIFLAAMIEGEVVFVSACVLVRMGRLDAVGVFLAAALGGSAGDQLYFLGLRGRLRRWLVRLPKLARVRSDVDAIVRQHATVMILACRFLPSLRIAIPAACAHADISRVRFSVLNLIGSFAWAASILYLVAHFGPEVLAQLGITAWWAPLVPGALVIAFFLWFRRGSRLLIHEGKP